MTVSPRQFGNYKFYGYKDRESNVVVTAFPAESGMQAGALRIDADQGIQRHQQRKISSGDYLGWAHETQDAGPREGQIEGQQRWSGGTFEPSYPKVSWLGVAADHRNPTVLAGMMGLASHLHGNRPLHADNTLSEAGASVSQHMAEKGMITPHPKNPTMEPNWYPIGRQDDVRSESEIADLTGTAWGGEYDDDDWEEDEDDVRAMDDEEWGMAQDRLTSRYNAHMGVQSLQATGERWPGAWVPENDGASVTQAVRALRTLHPAKKAKAEKIEQREAYLTALEDPKIAPWDRPKYQGTQKETLF